MWHSACCSYWKIGKNCHVMSSTTGVFLALVLFTASAQLPAQSDETVRLAVLSSSTQELAATDLLTVELSKQKPFHVLERDEIEKVEHEQGIAAETQNQLKLGHLLGADGLLLIQVTPGPDATNLSMELIAVRPGVILSAWKFPWPMTDPQPWARETAMRLNSFAPKLKVMAKDAIPISIVNLRSAVQTPEALEIERVLTLLTIHRLIQEPRVFVLERSHMELLGQEKDLKGDDSAFWSGGFLLDGTLDPDGYSKDALVVSARLTPARGGLPLRVIKLTSSRTNLSAIVTDLAAKVNEALRIEPHVSGPIPMDEAATYFEEAQWAFKWHLFREARAACESSWALGQQTRQVAELRIRACQQLAAPAWGGSAFLRPTRQNSAPDLSQLEPANRALQLYRQGFQTFLGGQERPDLTWYNLALDLLSSTSDFLRQFYLVPESRRGHEEQLAELRMLAREVAHDIEEHPAYRNLSGAANSMIIRSGNESHCMYWTGARDLATVRAAKGSFWYDTPDQALDVYREFAQSGRLHRLRRYLVYRQIIGWTPADQKRAPALWHDYIEGLCCSTNALLRVEGSFLAYVEARENPQQEEAARRSLFRVAVENARALGDANLADEFLKDVGTVLPNSGDRVEESLERAFRADFKASIEFGSADGKMPSLKRYPTNNTQLESHQFSSHASLAGVPPSAFLRVTRCWTVPYPTLHDASDYCDVVIARSCFRQGRFWLESLIGNPVRKAVIYSVDPGSFDTDAIEVPLEELGPSGGLEVLGDFVYVCKSDRISRFGLKTKRWEALPVPLEGSVPLTIGTQTSRVPGDVRMSVCGGRLIICTPDSILELSEDGQRVRILASARRRPAMNLLDSLEYSVVSDDRRGLPPVFQGPNESLRTLFQGKVYTCDTNTMDWSETLTLPPSEDPPLCLPFEAGMVFRQATSGQTRWWLLSNTRSSLDLLLAQPDAARPPSQARWVLPKELASVRSIPSFQGDTLCILEGELNLQTDLSDRAVLDQENGHHLTLFKYEVRSAQSSRTPLWFELPEEGYFSWLMPKLNLAGKTTEYPTDQGRKARYCLGPTVFQSTPEGFIISGNHVPGFWLLCPDSAQASRFSSSGRYRQDPTNNFFEAAEAGDLSRLRELIAQGVPVDARNDRGWTALMVSAKSSRRDAVSFLIEKGADVNARSTRAAGNTVLCFAAEGNQPDIVKTLLEHGADINARSGRGPASALDYAAWNGKREAAEILIAHGAAIAEPGLTDQYGVAYTPLMGAACANHPELVALLLASGANLEQRNNHGATALMEAAKRPCSDTVRLLLSKGANVNAADPEGHTALIFAAYNGRNETVKILLAAGANPNAKAAGVDDFDGRPYDAAEAATMRHYPETAAIIHETQKQGTF